MSSISHSAIPLDNTLGAILVGGLVTGILYGMVCVQSYAYLTNNRRDRKLLKTVVSLLWMLETLHLALVAHAMYRYMINNFGNYFALISIAWSVLGQIYVAIISEIIVRWFFGRRVWLLSRKNKVLIACIALLSILAFVFSFAFPTYVFIRKLTTPEFSKISYLIYTALGTGVLADVLIATFLCINLWKARTGFKRTDSLVRVLMMYTINTALLTSFCNLACLICFAIWSRNFLYVAFYFPVSNLFVNCLLASLNSRDAHLERLNALPHTSIPRNIFIAGPSSDISEPDLPTTNIELKESGSSLKSTLGLGTQTKHA